MKDALHLIITKSQRAAKAAMKTLLAIEEGKSDVIINYRYRLTFEQAVMDAAANWTAEDGILISQYMSYPPVQYRSQKIQIKVTEVELEILRELANENKITLSDYIRWKALKG